MRKTLLLTIALLLSTAMFAQSRAILLNESFNTSTVPAGWEVYNGGGPNWSVENTSRAGGTPRELQFFWDPNFTGISYLSMGVFNLTNIDKVGISFKHYYEHYSNTAAIGVATSSDGGATWNTAWTQTYDVTGQYVVDEIITSPDMGKADVKVALFFNGDSYDINYWCFDDIMMFSQEENDINLLSIDVNDKLGVGESEVAFTIKNLGTAAVESFEAKYQIEGIDAVTETFNVEVASFEERQFTFETPSFLYPGDYKLSIEITSVNGAADGDPNNNMAEKDITVGRGIAQRFPMIEHFSSATCYPCVFTNQDMEELTQANPDEYTYTKYPMNGPGTGDPYYINDCGTRRSYYSVQGVPMVFIDGMNVELPLTQEKFDERRNASTFVNIRGAFNVEGNTINITADFMSYVDLDNVKAHISVNEKTTTENAVAPSDGGNGETEFHHILMKMLESSQGNTISIKAGEYQRLEYSFDMSSTNMEDIDDLEVSLWIQNHSTKEIHNSHFAYEYTTHAYPVENLTLNFNDDMTDVNITWDAPQNGNPIGYNVFIDGTPRAVNTNELNFYDNTISYNDGNTHIVEVVALYENGKTSVGVVKTSVDGNSVTESKTEDFNIYPNPANDVVRLSTDNGQQTTVRIYNVMGMLVGTQLATSATNEIEINVSDYNPGIYFFNIQTEEFNVTKKIIVE